MAHERHEGWAPAGQRPGRSYACRIPAIGIGGSTGGGMRASPGSTRILTPERDGGASGTGQVGP
jgi:hypothetical protein